MLYCVVLCYFALSCECECVCCVVLDGLVLSCGVL